MFCGQGQSMIFTFLNAELLVIYLHLTCGSVQIHNDKQFEHILQCQNHGVNRYKNTMYHMSYGLAIGLSFLETKILVLLCTFRVTLR